MISNSQQRIENLKDKHPILAKILEITCDYGRSFTRFFAWCLTVIVLFGIFYSVIPNSLDRTGF